MTDDGKKIEPQDIITLKLLYFVSQEETKAEISKVPINILFDPEGIKNICDPSVVIFDVTKPINFLP